MHTRDLLIVGWGATLFAFAAPADAQQIRGRVIDASNESPVHLAGVWLLDGDRGQVALAMADSVGRYFLTVPDSGEYYIVAERFGYFLTESPLFAISGERDYDLDLELRPEPIRVGGLDVTVRNEEVVDWLVLEYGRNPAEFFGFRVLQGERLQQAKMRGEFNPTETLRWLYIPVWHGRCVSINPYPRAEHPGLMLRPRISAFGPGAAPAGTVSREQQAAEAQAAATASEECTSGGLYVDDRRIPNEHIDSIDLSTIAVVVTLPNLVRMYTYGFDWSFR